MMNQSNISKKQILINFGISANLLESNNLSTQELNILSSVKARNLMLALKEDEIQERNIHANEVTINSQFSTALGLYRMDQESFLDLCNHPERLAEQREVEQLYNGYFANPTYNLADISLFGCINNDYDKSEDASDSI